MELQRDHSSLHQVALDPPLRAFRQDGRRALGPHPGVARHSTAPVPWGGSDDMAGAPWVLHAPNQQDLGRPNHYRRCALQQIGAEGERWDEIEIGEVAAGRHEHTSNAKSDERHQNPSSKFRLHHQLWLRAGRELGTASRASKTLTSQDMLCRGGTKVFANQISLDFSGGRCLRLVRQVRLVVWNPQQTQVKHFFK